MIDHKGPSAAEPQPKVGISRAKTQRRKGKKGFRTWRLGDLARVNPRFHELPPFGEFAQTAQTFKYSNAMQYKVEKGYL